MCSSVLGPAMPPPLVTWPTTTTAVPLSLAKRMSWPGALAHLADVARGALERVGVDGLDGIDDHDLGADRRRRAEDGLEPGLAEHVDRARVLVHQPLGAEPDLIGRLLAAGVEHGAPAVSEPGRRLQQQGGLADAGLAADEDHRAGHDAAAKHEVEFGEPRAPALERVGGDVPEPGRRRSAAAAAGTSPTRGAPTGARRRPAPPPRNSTLRTPHIGRPTWDARGRIRCSGRRTLV